MSVSLIATRANQETRIAVQFELNYCKIIAANAIILYNRIRGTKYSLCHLSQLWKVHLGRAECECQYECALKNQRKPHQNAEINCTLNGACQAHNCLLVSSIN